MAQESMNTDSIEKSIDKYLTYFSNDNPGAVVSVIKEGNIIFNKSYGLANVESKSQLSVNNVFNIAALSKQFTALAILKLVEKRKISLDDNLQKIFPNFPDYGANIKVKNLLDHTSGLPPYDVNNINSNGELFEFLIKQNELTFKPGTKWQHSNSDYALLAYIIEKVSKMSYKQYLDKYVFRKLQMNNTYVGANKVIDNNNLGHFKIDDSYVPRRETDLVLGEQGIYTNSIDFAKWDKSLYSNQLLRCENLKEFFTVHPTKDNINTVYGFGWIVMTKYGVKYYWHGGSVSGYTNLVLHIPDLKLTVLLLSNRNDGYEFLKMAIYIAQLFEKNLNLL